MEREQAFASACDGELEDSDRADESRRAQSRGVVLYFLPKAYATLAQGAMPEALLTTAVTTLVFVAVPRKYHASDHLGLGIISERAQAIGADLKVESQVGRGTRITVVWKDGT